MRCTSALLSPVMSVGVQRWMLRFGSHCIYSKLWAMGHVVWLDTTSQFCIHLSLRCLSWTAVCISLPLPSKCPPFRASRQLAPLASDGGHMSLCILWWTLDLPEEGCLLWKTLLRVMQPDRHDLRSTLILLHQVWNFFLKGYICVLTLPSRFCFAFVTQRDLLIVVIVKFIMLYSSWYLQVLPGGI